MTHDASVADDLAVAEPPVQVTFVPTVDDYVHASRETLRFTGRDRWLVRIGVPVIMGGMLAMIVADEGWRALYGSGLTYTVLLACWVLLPLAWPVLLRWIHLRQLRQNPHFNGPIAYTFTVRGVHLETPLGTSDMPWTSFVRARETREQILLFFARKTAYFVPRRALREEDERRLRGWLAARLGARAEFSTSNDR